MFLNEQTNVFVGFFYFLRVNIYNRVGNNNSMRNYTWRVGLNFIKSRLILNKLCLNNQLILLLNRFKFRHISMVAVFDFIIKISR